METFISHAHAYFEFESCLLNHILNIDIIARTKSRCSFCTQSLGIAKLGIEEIFNCTNWKLGS